jgi:phosphotransferase system  glucose/maltose/N-acetylglucosamine-specific IIC component
MVVPTDTESKKKELERLLQENKIELDQYLETVTKLEASPSTEGLGSAKDKQVKSFRLMRTDYFLLISPLLALVGWLLAVSGSVSGYESTLSSYETVGYPFSPLGVAIMMVAAILFSVGIAYRWVKSTSRGAVIVLEVVGWFPCTNGSEEVSRISSLIPFVNMQ